MKVWKFPKKYHPEDTVQFFGFEKFENLAGDFLFIDGRINFKALESAEFKNKKIVYLELEEPNRFFSANSGFRREGTDKYFHKILTDCPYTAEWLNKKQNNNKRISPIFIPFNEEYTPPVTEKIYDVIYIGGIHSRCILDDIQAITKFNYRFVASSEWLFYKVWRNTKVAQKILSFFPKSKTKFITNKAVTYKEKLRLTSQSKIAIVHTLLFATAGNVRNIQNTEGWRENKAFASIPNKSFWNTASNYLFNREYLIPQGKGRIMEAAFCRSLLLCRKDPFNEIERYFEPEKEFVYYEDGKLEEKIREILGNWDHYKTVVENAFEKAKREYTTKRFVEKYLSPLS